MEEIEKKPNKSAESKESFTYKDLIVKLVEETYNQEKNKSFYEFQCLEFSNIMYEKLLEKGISKETITRLRADVKNLTGSTKPHHFLRVGDYMVDGTWQQYLDKPRNDNKCLILDVYSLAADLKKAGVPEELWFIYLQNKNKFRAA